MQVLSRMMSAEEELCRLLCLQRLPCPLATALSHLAPPKQQVSFTMQLLVRSRVACITGGAMNPFAHRSACGAYMASDLPL